MDTWVDVEARLTALLPEWLAWVKWPFVRKLLTLWRLPVLRVTLTRDDRLTFAFRALPTDNETHLAVKIPVDGSRGDILWTIGGSYRRLTNVCVMLERDRTDRKRWHLRVEDDCGCTITGPPGLVLPLLSMGLKRAGHERRQLRGLIEGVSHYHEVMRYLWSEVTRLEERAQGAVTEVGMEELFARYTAWLAKQGGEA